MRWPTRSLALLVLLSISPGASELLVDGGHYLFHGDSVHAAPADADHSPVSPEHGCSGTFHVCSCHNSSSFVVAARPPKGTGFEDPRQSSSSPKPSVLEGHSRRVDHPPRA